MPSHLTYVILEDDFDAFYNAIHFCSAAKIRVTLKNNLTPLTANAQEVCFVPANREFMSKFATSPRNQQAGRNGNSVMRHHLYPQNGPHKHLKHQRLPRKFVLLGNGEFHLLNLRVPANPSKELRQLNHRANAPKSPPFHRNQRLRPVNLRKVVNPLIKQRSYPRILHRMLHQPLPPPLQVLSFKRRVQLGRNLQNLTQGKAPMLRFQVQP